MAAIRFIDIVGSAAVLVLLSPLLLLLAALIRLDTPGPVFCTRERVGSDGRSFFVLKFCIRHTRLGPFLRRFSVDELPGFISVLLGEMCLTELQLK